jgi:hypothetical protein
MSLKVLPDNLAEWLKRSPAKRLDYVLTGSNPVVVAHGGVAQMVERVLSMHEVVGSMPTTSTRLTESL